MTEAEQHQDGHANHYPDPNHIPTPNTIPNPNPSGVSSQIDPPANDMSEYQNLSANDIPEYLRPIANEVTEYQNMVANDVAEYHGLVATDVAEYHTVNPGAAQQMPVYLQLNPDTDHDDSVCTQLDWEESSKRDRAWLGNVTGQTETWVPMHMIHSTHM